MIYETPEDWLAARHRRVALFGMSGLGKTRIAAMLREEGDWFHYSVDFRIGTRYMTCSSRVSRLARGASRSRRASRDGWLPGRPSSPLRRSRRACRASRAPRYRLRRRRRRLR